MCVCVCLVKHLDNIAGNHKVTSLVQSINVREGRPPSSHSERLSIGCRDWFGVGSQQVHSSSCCISSYLLLHHRHLGSRINHNLALHICSTGLYVEYPPTTPDATLAAGSCESSWLSLGTYGQSLFMCLVHPQYQQALLGADEFCFRSLPRRQALPLPWRWSLPVRHPPPLVVPAGPPSDYCLSLSVRFLTYSCSCLTLSHSDSKSSLGTVISSLASSKEPHVFLLCSVQPHWEEKHPQSHRRYWSCARLSVCVCVWDSVCHWVVRWAEQAHFFPFQFIKSDNLLVKVGCLNIICRTNTEFVASPFPFKREI